MKFKEFMRDLHIVRYLCPFCGEWHDWPESSVYYPFCYRVISFHCIHELDSMYNLSIAELDDFIDITIESVCCFPLGDKSVSIPLSKIKYHHPSIITFDINLTSDIFLIGQNESECKNCKFISHCNFGKLGDLGDNEHLNIKLGFEFDNSNCAKLSQFFSM